MNLPYVKQYDENGNCKNPITATRLYKSAVHPTRAQRRRKPPRFKGCGKNHSLTLMPSEDGRGVVKFHRMEQWIGNKRILHYVR